MTQPIETYTVKTLAETIGMSVATVRIRISKLGLEAVGEVHLSRKGRGTHLYSFEQMLMVRNYILPEAEFVPVYTIYAADNKKESIVSSEGSVS